MKRLIILTVLLCLAGNVYGAGFDCTKASTTVEHLVCNDAELSKMDDALVSAYTRIISQASDREAVKTAQKEWLKRRDACKDAACLKKVYTSRLTVLTSKVSTTKNTSTFVGEYKRYLHGKLDKDQSTIRIKGLPDGRVHIEGSACWVGKAETGDVNTGELDGTFRIEGNTIYYKDGNSADSCKLTIIFSENALRVIDDNMNCGGLNVTFNGDYRKTKDDAAKKTFATSTQFVREFYDVFYANYEKYMGNKDRKLNNFKKLFEPKNYFTGTISSFLINNERIQLASPGKITGLDFDPFSGAQDEIGKPIIGDEKSDGTKTLVTVTFSMAPKHKVILELTQSQNSFAISNIFYPDDHTDLLKLFSTMKTSH